MILSLFKGIGNALKHVPEVGSLLFTFLKQYYEELSLSCPKLSENQIQIKCLLLESCVMSSSYGGNDLQDVLLKISFSTVGYMLAPKSFIVSSSNEKVKKQKLIICRRDNPVYILSSLLDVLLLKKAITNRHMLVGPLFK
ncbi:hypothetical protein VNO80_05727 [Phaseolus coccineus]|uniref:Uncharacterized protein n=1 Tax=Phaseolus coccineus TaxID=3886 RepID=A0AAN9RI46_PHACN